MQKKGVMFPLLDGILRAVNEIDSQNISLDDALDDAQIIPQDMRRTAAHWLFSIFRYRVEIEKYIKDFAGKGKIKSKLFNLCIAGAAHCVFQNRIAREAGVNAIVEYAKVKIGHAESRFINALLRKICRENIVFTARLPHELQKKWRKTFGDEFILQAEKCLAAVNEQTFRLRKGFGINGFEAEKIVFPILKHFDFYKTSEMEKCLESACFKAGGIYIQDPATGAAAELLSNYINKEKGKFIDVCGAPGGKAIMFHDLFPEWQISIADRSAKRQERTQENLSRLKINAELLTFDAAQDNLSEKYNVLFADVPCSNSGVFRKRPDALYRLNERTINEIAELQRQILENVCKFVTEDGLLLYSTCSIESDEDSLQIASFCQRHNEFELLEERLILPDTDHDGAYSACLRRKK